MAKDLRLKIYPVVIAILGFSLVAVLLSRVEIQVSRESAAPGDLAPTPPDSTPEPNSSPTESPQAASPTPTAPASPAAPASPSPASLPATEAMKAQGRLRVSNQTTYPVRVALLYQPSDAAGGNSAANSAKSSYGQPVHWDFAPGEGESKGLLLSLPSGNLRLQAGDVLVAFAQDGSRRYWGPYVVGKTTLPTWNSQQKEWSLVLQP